MTIGQVASGQRVETLFIGALKKEMEKERKKKEKGKDNQYKLKKAMANAIGLTTVGCKKLDPHFFLNNSLNIQRRTLKPPAMCFY